MPLTPEQAEALIPDQLLQQLQNIINGGPAGPGGLVAPPCRKQGLYDFGGEKTQYPHVNARGDQ